MIADGPVQGGGHEFQRLPVQVDVGGVEFEGTQDPGEQRDHDDAQDEERGDPDAFGPFEDVGDRGVDEHHGDDPEPDGALALLPAAGRERDGDRRGGHQHQHAGGVGAALGVDVGVEEDR